MDIPDSKIKSDLTEWYTISNQNHFWVYWRFLAIRKYLSLSNLSSKRIADVGCGIGTLAAQIKSYVPCHIDGFEIEKPRQSEILINSNALDTFSVYDLLTRDIKHVSKYDYIFALDVIEHINDPEEFLKACNDHLKPGGLLVINVPALKRFYSRYDVAAGHFKRYEKEELLRELTNANFTSVRAMYWGLSLLPFLILRNVRVFFSKNIITDGFKPPNKLFNFAMKMLARCECKVLNEPMMGTSLIATATKLN
jgi:SAM-dependent methyltransferase